MAFGYEYKFRSKTDNQPVREQILSFPLQGLLNGIRTEIVNQRQRAIIDLALGAEVPEN
jgi:hypothetical protein